MDLDFLDWFGRKKALSYKLRNMEKDELTILGLFWKGKKKSGRITKYVISVRYFEVIYKVLHSFR